MKLFSRALCVTALFFACLIATHAQTPVSLIPVPRTQFLSASGAPLAGGFVYVYCAGTSNPCPTYLDSSGTSLATNPIQLDSGGFASIWIPAGTVDVAVDDANMVQQYKVLSVTALPSTVTSLTAGYFQSSTVNPALSGFLRMANTDSICWRNGGNSSDNCINQNLASQLSYAGNMFAFLTSSIHTPQTWIGPNIFAGLSWTDSGSQTGTFNQNNTLPRNYLFPDASGTVCVSALCNVTNPAINGVTITGTPTTANQVLISTSPTTATWGVGSILDYDDYQEIGGLSGSSACGANRTDTVPAGAIQQAGWVGSFVEGETEFTTTTHTGSTAVYTLKFNTVTVATFNLSDNTTYDVKFSMPSVTNANPPVVVNVTDSSPGVTYMAQTRIPLLSSANPFVLSDAFSGCTTLGYNSNFLHVRIRQ